MNNVTGTPVGGSDFFGRDAELYNCMELMKHNDILLLGARRIGKTSFAREIMRRLNEEGWRVIEINVASCEDEQQFAKRVLEAIRDSARSWPQKKWDSLCESIGGILRRIEHIEVPIPNYGNAGVKLNHSKPVKDLLDSLTEALCALNTTDEPCLLYIDELPIFLYNLMPSTDTKEKDYEDKRKRVALFLNWLRNDVRGDARCTALRWLFTGSVGLDTLVHNHKLADTINTLTPFKLDAFSSREAVIMLQTLAISYGWSLDEGDANKVVDVIQWPQPYYLQIAFRFLREWHTEERSFDQCIKHLIEKMTEPGVDNDYNHWFDRLKTQLGNVQAGHAKALLGMVCATPEGMSKHDVFIALQGRMLNATEDEQLEMWSDLRDILERDAYWWSVEVDGVKYYRFCLEPLRCWWKRKYDV
ncbi:ATP-binding protein [Desulfovibrio inopinatus]|uniref:ATP-binding protein n=1 Tax=Desulfovibrio inopinatus TaxID=102109 RepID=UPI0004290677|nr:ATP-binding protein [Desulfovibrio inopinatus]